MFGIAVMYYIWAKAALLWFLMGLIRVLYLL